MNDVQTQKLVDSVADATRSDIGEMSPEQLDLGWQRLESSLSDGRYPSVPIVGAAPRWWLRGFALAAAALVLGFAARGLLSTRRALPLHYVLEGATLGPGETIQAGPYSIQFKKVEEVEGPNYAGVGGLFEVTRDGKPVAMMKPEKRFYKATQQTMTEAAIDHGLTRDVYLSLGNQIDDKTWEVRAQVKPFINWIWIGCVIMALGGLLAILDRRYRLRRKTAAEAVGDAGPEVVAT